MKRVKLITAILLVILAICVAAVNAKDKPNTITFDNLSGSPALVKLIGPTPQIIHATNGQKRTVNVAAGEYYILVRYGSSPERFRYSKGNTFSVRQTASQYSAISIALHRVVGGNYPSRESSSEEFNKAIATQQIAETDKATLCQVQKRLKELGYNPGPLDGIWGKKTVAAIKAYQKKNGLSITGKINSETKGKLLIAKQDKSENEIAAKSKPYPWKSILVREYNSPDFSPTAAVLQVFVDLDREISSEEYNLFSKLVKLIDGNGKEYKPVGRVSGSGVKITQTLDDRVIFSWSADFAYSFLFSVQSRKCKFSLLWDDCPPLDIGNPFKAIYCRP